MHLSTRSARRAILRVVIVIGGMLAAVAVSGEPLSLVMDEQQAGASACGADPSADTNDYLLGIACPPPDFQTALGYEPVLRRTSAGWRYVKPEAAGGGCSGPIDETGPFWDFGDACRTHDYAYDLVRLGVGSRPDADRLLFLDMISGCGDQPLTGRFGCRAIARWARVTLDIGESLRMDPGAVSRGTARGGHWTHHSRQPFGSGFERVLMLGLAFGVLALQVVRVQVVPRTVHGNRARPAARRLERLALAHVGSGRWLAKRRPRSLPRGGRCSPEPEAGSRSGC